MPVEIRSQFGYSLDTLWKRWNNIVDRLSYRDNDTVRAKWFNLLNEQYESKDKTFSTWEQVYRSIDAIDNLVQVNNVSENTQDIMVFATFFSYFHFDQKNCDSFSDSAEISFDCSESFELLESDSRKVHSLITSLDMASVFDQYQNVMYHVMRDAHFIWLAYPPAGYLEIAEKLCLEFNDVDPLWISYRKSWISEYFESEFLFHTDFCFHNYSEAAQNNLMDELQLYSEIKV